jgi:hypothetical protein
MYWCKSKLFLFAALSWGIFLSACKPAIKETGASLKYFDLKGYFKKDSARLAKQNPLVFKTVSHNGTDESKQVHIANWGLELSLFKESDINLPALKDSYSITADSNFLIYRAKYPELKTREILIKKLDGKVKWIVIFNQSKNILFHTAEKLSYLPDSLYMIEKSQSVRFLGTNKYRIKGVLINDGQLRR